VKGERCFVNHDETRIIKGGCPRSKQNTMAPIVIFGGVCVTTFDTRRKGTHHSSKQAGGTGLADRAGNLAPDVKLSEK